LGGFITPTCREHHCHCEPAIPSLAWL